ncbi:ABC-2 family transporter protein [Segatella salivae F0493]|uniref:Transport permease protein n=2 Tax=Segatella salivae TaxID=228604 RepID=U2KLN0_9BACT|nr:ABC-2 family transporter protein [Segatella salivae F0493]
MRFLLSWRDNPTGKVFSMKEFWSFIIKETQHIMRDRRTMMILFGMPIILMLIFGFAISTDVRNVRTVVVMSQIDHQTQRMINALDESEYFKVLYKVHTPAEAEQLIRNQKADMGIVFSTDFASKHGGVQLIIDGTDPNMAQQYNNYASQIMGTQLMNVMQRKSPSAIALKMLYNPQMKSSYNFVPGIMGILLMLICAMMTSISIVREKERGTMEVLLVSPVRPFLIILAKAVPYLVLAFVVLLAILLMSRYVLFVPIAGSLWLILLVSTIYIFMALSLGLLISTIAKTQMAALLMSAVMLLMPCTMLSGMMFPIESMPHVLQWVAALIPPRYYISAMRKLLIMGVSFQYVLPEIITLLGMTTLFLTVALLKFNKRLG